METVSTASPSAVSVFSFLSVSSLSSVSFLPDFDSLSFVFSDFSVLDVFLEVSFVSLDCF